MCILCENIELIKTDDILKEDIFKYDYINCKINIDFYSAIKMDCLILV